MFRLDAAVLGADTADNTNVVAVSPSDTAADGLLLAAFDHLERVINAHCPDTFERTAAQSALALALRLGLGSMTRQAHATGT